MAFGHYQIKRFRKFKVGDDSYHHPESFGQGTRLLDETDMTVTYNSNGKAVYLQYLCKEFRMKEP